MAVMRLLGWQGENARVSSVAASSKNGRFIFLKMINLFITNWTVSLLDQLNWILGLEPFRRQHVTVEQAIITPRTDFFGHA